MQVPDQSREERRSFADMHTKQGQKRKNTTAKITLKQEEERQTNDKLVLEDDGNGKRNGRTCC